MQVVTHSTACTSSLYCRLLSDLIHIEKTVLLHWSGIEAADLPLFRQSSFRYPSSSLVQSLVSRASVVHSCVLCPCACTKYCRMSSSHRLRGWDCLLRLARFECKRGCQCSARWVHLSSSRVATRPAHCHLRRRLIDTQSSNLSCCIFCSASLIAHLIHSVQLSSVSGLWLVSNRSCC